MRQTICLLLISVGLGATAANGDTLLERGAYLVEGPAACGNCHTPQGPNGPIEGMTLAGGLPIVEPGAFTVHTPNITQDVETGIGGWSDDEIALAVREGKLPDGGVIRPPMPIGLYRGISDTDLQAIVAYIQTAPAINNTPPAAEYTIPTPPGYGPPVGSVADIPRDDAVAYGAYLAGPIAHCVECHTPLTPQGPDLSRLMGGGNTFHGPWGESISPALTSDALADWTDADIAKAVRQGIRPDGSRMLPPMGYSYYANITDEDMAAIIAWLRTVPRIDG